MDVWYYRISVACDTMELEFILLSPSLVWSIPIGLPRQCGIWVTMNWTYWSISGHILNVAYVATWVILWRLILRSLGCSKSQLFSLKTPLEYGMFTLESGSWLLYAIQFLGLVFRVGCSLLLDPTLNPSPKSCLPKKVATYACISYLGTYDLGSCVKW